MICEGCLIQEFKDGIDFGWHMSGELPAPKYGFNPSYPGSCSLSESTCAACIEIKRPEKSVGSSGLIKKFKQNLEINGGCCSRKAGRDPGESGAMVPTRNFNVMQPA